MLFDIEPATLAPSASRRALTSRRDRLKAPVTTKVVPRQRLLSLIVGPNFLGIDAPCSETIDQEAASIVGEPRRQRRRQRRTDAIDGLQLLRGCRREDFQVREPPGELLRRPLADAGNPEGEKQPMEGPRSGGFQLANEFVRRGFLPSRQLCQDLGLEIPQRRLVGHQTGVDQLIELLAAETLDLHRAASGEVAQARGDHRRALGVGAAQRDLTVLAHDTAAARGAVGGDRHRFGVRRPLGAHDADHLGDHFPALGHPDGVSDHQVETFDLGEIVQRRARDRRTRERHRFELGDRGQDTGPADLHHHVANHRRPPLGGELVGNGPTHRARRGAQRRPLGRTVELDYDSIGVEVKRPAPLFPTVDEGFDLDEARAALNMRTHR